MVQSPASVQGNPPPMGTFIELGMIEFALQTKGLGPKPRPKKKRKNWGDEITSGKLT